MRIWGMVDLGLKLPAIKEKTNPKAYFVTNVLLASKWV